MLIKKNTNIWKHINGQLNVTCLVSCDWSIVKRVAWCVFVCVYLMKCVRRVSITDFDLYWESSAATSSRRHVSVCSTVKRRKKKSGRIVRFLPEVRRYIRFCLSCFFFFILTFCHTVWLRAITTVTHTDVTSRPRRVKCVVHFQLCLSWCHAVQLLIRRQVWQSLPYFLPHRVSPSLSQTGLTLSPKQRETRRDRQMAVTEGEEERNEELEGEQKKKKEVRDTVCQLEWGVRSGWGGKRAGRYH